MTADGAGGKEKAAFSGDSRALALQKKENPV